MLAKCRIVVRSGARDDVEIGRMMTRRSLDGSLFVCRQMD